MDRSTAAKVLGLPESPTEAQVKEAYKTLAHKYDTQQYEAGPLRQEAEQKMEELNQAFDVLMSWLRTGQESSGTHRPAGSTLTGNYPSIRQLINTGQVDTAIEELNGLGESGSAEWNFLMGSAFYYKGWLDRALHYFQTASGLDPENREYQAALRDLQNAAGGQQPGNPYPQGRNMAPLGCACNTCSMLCCMDACCGLFRGM